MAINFSIPPIPSLTSREPNKLPILFIPDIKFIQKFSKGEIGAAKKLLTNLTKKQLTDIKSPENLKKFLELSGANIGTNPEQYFQNGKFVPPVNLDLDTKIGNLGGLEALEKSLIQSIFETQKPFIEIVKLVTENFVEIEDIVAHVLGLISRSNKPAGNPRALGYQGQQEGGGAGVGLNALGRISSKQGLNSKLSNGDFSVDKIQSVPDKKTNPNTGGYIAITISTIYSTGQFEENVDYKFEYRDIIEEADEIFNQSNSTSIEEDEIDGDKKETVILGVYNRDWEPFTKQQVDTRFPWLSKKYLVGPWQQIKPAVDLDYVWVGKIAGIELFTNIGSPGSPTDIFGVPINWEIKRYKEEGPSINTPDGEKFIKEGKKMLAYNSDKTQSLFNFYKSFYLEYTKTRLDKTLAGQDTTFTDENGVKKDIKIETVKELEAKINNFSENGMIPVQLELLMENNFMIHSSNKTDGLLNVDKFIENLSYPFKPIKINDKWYDIESEYDMKILKCDVTNQINFRDTIGSPEKRGIIRRFIDKSLRIELVDNQRIRYEIITGNTTRIIDNQSSITIDFFRESGRNRIAILELGDTFDLIGGQLPIKFDVNKPSQEFTKWKEFQSISSIGISVTYRDKFEIGPNGNLKLVTERFDITKNRWFRQRLDIKKSPYNAKPYTEGGTNQVLINFRGSEIIINKTNLFFISSKSGELFNQYVPDINQVNTVTYNSLTNEVVSVSQEISPNLIRIEDVSGNVTKAKIITGLGTSANITNQQLDIDGVLGVTPYGTPISSDEPGESRNQNVEQIYRFPVSEDDTETIYIIEAVLRQKNNNPLRTPNEEREIQGQSQSGGSGGGSGSYTWRNIFSVIPKFIRLLIKIYTKLLPAIQKLMSIIRNPAQFITDIIIAKIGDDFGTRVPNFGFFSKEFLTQLKEIRDYIVKLKTYAEDPNRLIEAKEELKAYYDQSLLKNYVHISDKGVAKFLLDGASTIKLFGDAPMLRNLPQIVFGLESKLGSLMSETPEMPFKLIFKLDRINSSLQKNLSDFLAIPDDFKKVIEQSELFNSFLNPKFEFKNQIITGAAGNQNIEEVSVVYSTGIFRDDVIYDYINLTQEQDRLLREANDLESAGDSDSLKKAASKLEEALQIDPSNKFIKDKLDALKNIIGQFTTNPIFDFLLNFVTLPLKVVFGIIKYIMDFFKSLADPFSLPEKITEFLSFKWILDFFSPISENSMFNMAGILFDIPKFLTVWMPNLKLPNDVGGIQKFDLNEIIKLPWIKFPVYTREQFKSLIFGLYPGGLKPPSSVPIQILNSILCYIESIINSFIDFIWSLFGMSNPVTGKFVVLKPPYINLCKNINKNLSPKDIITLLNGTTDIGSATQTQGVALNPSLNDVETTYNFIYDIKTSDGRELSSLNQQELDKWLEENKDLEFQFNFN